MKREDKYSLTVGASMQPATTKSYGRTDRDTSYSVINFAPSARFDYNFSESKMLRIRYRGRTSQPSINQLMPIPDNSNPLKISLGNPNLNPEFSHNIWSIGPIICRNRAGWELCSMPLTRQTKLFQG